MLRCHLPSRAPRRFRLNLSETSLLFSYVPFLVLLSHSPAIRFSWKHFPKKSRAHESSSQVLIPGELDLGRKIIHTQPLSSGSSVANWRLICHKLGNSWFTRIPFGENAIFVWKEVLIKLPGAKLISHSHECSWYQDFKREG